MQEALFYADEGRTAGEIPVGCVIVRGNEIVAGSSNFVERLSDPTAHAELIAIKTAAEKLGKELSDCDLFVTVEPCAMCAGAIINAKIRNLYFGTEEPKTGCCGTNYNLVEDARFNSNPRVYRGIKREDCKKRMTDFFVGRRKQ